MAVSGTHEGCKRSLRWLIQLSVLEKKNYPRTWGEKKKLEPKNTEMDLKEAFSSDCKLQIVMVFGFTAPNFPPFTASWI